MKPLYWIIIAILLPLAACDTEEARITKEIESRSARGGLAPMPAPTVISISCEERGPELKICDVYGEMKGAKNLPAGPFLRWHCALSDKQTRCDPVMSIYAELGEAR